MFKPRRSKIRRHQCHRESLVPHQFESELSLGNRRIHPEQESIHGSRVSRCHRSTSPHQPEPPSTRQGAIHIQGHDVRRRCFLGFQRHDPRIANLQADREQHRTRGVIPQPERNRHGVAGPTHGPCGHQLELHPTGTVPILCNDRGISHDGEANLPAALRILLMLRRGTGWTRRPVAGLRQPPTRRRTDTQKKLAKTRHGYPAAGDEPE